MNRVTLNRTAHQKNAITMQNSWPSAPTSEMWRLYSLIMFSWTPFCLCDQRPEDTTPSACILWWNNEWKLLHNPASIPQHKVSKCQSTPVHEKSRGNSLEKMEWFSSPWALEIKPEFGRMVVKTCPNHKGQTCWQSCYPHLPPGFALLEWPGLGKHPWIHRENVTTNVFCLELSKKYSTNCGFWSPIMLRYWSATKLLL